MPKQCLTLLKHAIMLKQCLSLLKHSKTVVNTVCLKSEPCELISLSFFSWTRCELWARGQEPCELISLSNALWAVSKSSRARPQREWVWEVREVKSEKKKPSLFVEKCKVKKICLHSFSRSAKWKKNAFTFFREVKSEIKMLRDRDREVKILENSWQFSRNEILQQNYSTRRRRWPTSKMTSPARR